MTNLCIYVWCKTPLESRQQMYYKDIKLAIMKQLEKFKNIHNICFVWNPETLCHTTENGCFDEATQSFVFHFFEKSMLTLH